MILKSQEVRLKILPSAFFWPMALILLFFCAGLILPLPALAEAKGEKSGDSGTAAENPPQAASGESADLLGAGEAFAADNAMKYGHISIYTMPGRFSPMALDEFAKRTGYQVRQDFYRSFAELLSSSESEIFGNYDLLLVPGAAVKRLADKKLLDPINLNLLANKGNTYQKFNTVGYYRGQPYGVPLFWWLLGILKNDQALDLCQNQTDGWLNFLNTGCHKRPIVLPNVPRGLLGITLQGLGYPFNSVAESQLGEVSAKLKAVAADPLFLGFVSFEQSAQMCAQGFLSMVVTTNRSASQAIKENPRLVFVQAKEGVPAATEVLCLSAKSKNKKMAMEFMDFFLSPDVAAANARYSNISTANFAAWALMGQAGRDKVLYPDDEVFRRMDFPLDLGQGNVLYEQIWRGLTGGVYESTLVY